MLVSTMGKNIFEDPAGLGNALNAMDKYGGMNKVNASSSKKSVAEENTIANMLRSEILCTNRHIS
jgi:hypothetical protein